jgi:ribosomal protein S18 acetylase RimI-like enzyme
VTVLVRPATLDDVSAIQRIGHETWPATYAFAGSDYVEHGLASWWSEQSIAASLATTQNLVAEVDGDVVGMGNVDLRPETPVIWKLYVLPTSQGTGAGRALIEALIALVPADRGAVLLEYTDGNERAAAFYRRNGFVELRRDPPEQEGWPDQVWMTRNVAD